MLFYQCCCDNCIIERKTISGVTSGQTITLDKVPKADINRLYLKFAIEQEGVFNPLTGRYETQEIFVESIKIAIGSISVTYERVSTDSTAVSTAQTLIRLNKNPLNISQTPL